MHLLYAVAPQAVFEVAVEGGEGVGMGAGLHLLHPEVVDSKRLRGAAIVHEGHLAALQGSHVGAVGSFQEQLLVAVGYLPVLLLQRIDARIEGHFAVGVVASAIVGHEARLVERGLVDAFQREQRLVVHTRIAVLERQFGQAFSGERGVSHSLSQLDTLLEIVNGGVVDKGEVFFEQLVREAEPGPRVGCFGELGGQAVDGLRFLSNELWRLFDGSVEAQQG